LEEYSSTAYERKTTEAKQQESGEDAFWGTLLLIVPSFSCHSKIGFELKSNYCTVIVIRERLTGILRLVSVTIESLTENWKLFEFEG